MTIVSIRGTHGSGKSSIVTKIMSLYKTYERVTYGPGQKPITQGYSVVLPTGDELFIVGPYKTACGGCDAVQPYSDILPRIQAALALTPEAKALKYSETQHVLLEGALVSSSYGSIGHAMNEMEDPVFAFLDTPLDECLRRIAARRAAKGNFEPVNPKNTSVKFENVARTKDQMRRLGSRIRIVDIDHTQAVRQVLKLFGVNLRKEPK